MTKILSALVAAVFAVASLPPAFATEKKEETTSTDKKSAKSKDDEKKAAKSEGDEQKANPDEKKAGR